MRIFDEVDPASIDRRELHLWVLALTVIVVMILGLALMMYPAIFEHPVVLNGPVAKNAFFGFCALSFLMLGYFVDRQVVIRHLRRRLAQENRRLISLRQQASSDMLATLPGLDQFRDCLAMEYRRAFNAHQPISLVAVSLSPSENVREESEVIMTYGDALKALARKLRGEDSIYQFAPGVFGIVLPGVGPTGAQSVVRRLTEGLHDASGADSRFTFSTKITNYPGDVTTAREMEEAVRAVLPDGDVAACDGAARETVLAS
jgi:GGDEF domain-containing protein